MMMEEGEVGKEGDGQRVPLYAAIKHLDDSELIDVSLLRIDLILRFWTSSALLLDSVHGTAKCSPNAVTDTKWMRFNPRTKQKCS